jgi:cysteinyl-tRNA synthetase
MSRPFRLYDTMTREVRELKTREDKHLRFYSCGPTVYSYAHIGNFRTFLTADLVVRTAEALGWQVTYVSNITDVGHLTQDDVADAAGDDKMAKALESKEGEQFHNVWELAEYYEDAFKEDWARMNLKEPQVRPRATQHMREQIVAVENLIKAGHAYETPTGVYFSVNSFEDYGKLSGNRDQDNLERGVREVVVDDNKRHPSDFALWKKDDKHLMQWFSPWGWGFPGWHIECSAMARVYLGDTIDLHAGGEDLVFPHHECEIAQSESLTGKPFSNHWMHVRFLQVDGAKMSKSLGNFYTLRDLVEKGVDPMAIRYALLATPYGKPLNFTMQGLKDAAGNVDRFREVERRVEAALGAKAWEAEGESSPELERLADETLAALCDDLNTSVAIAKALEGVKHILRENTLSEGEAQAATWFLHRVNALLGIVRPENPAHAQAAETEDVDASRIDALIVERAEAKKSKNFARADEIRKSLEAEGIELRDSPEGTTWVRKARL